MTHAHGPDDARLAAAPRQPDRLRASLALLLVLAAAAALRFAALDRHGLWVDEGYTAWLTASPVSSYHDHLLSDTAPPLYYYLTRPLALMAPRSVFVLRLLPAIVGIVSVWLIYLLASELISSRWAGLTAAALLATNRLHIAHSQEARNYSLYFALSLSAMYCLARLARPAEPGSADAATPAHKGRLALWAGFVLSGAGMIYTHNVGAFFLVGLVAYYPLACWWNGGGARLWPLHRYKPLRDIVLASALIGLIYLPWLSVLRTQLRHVMRDYWIAKPTVPKLLNDLGRLVWLPPGATEGHPAVYRAEVAGRFFGMLVWASAVAGWTIVTLRRRDRRGPALLAAMVLSLAGLIVVSLVGQSLLMEKAIIPFLVVPLVGAAALAGPSFRTDRARLARALLALLLASSVATAVTNHGLRFGEQWREAAHWAVAQAEPHKAPIVVDANFHLMPVEWYVHDTPYGPVNWDDPTPGLLLHRLSLRPVAPPTRSWNQAELIVARLRQLVRPGGQFLLIQRGRNKTDKVLEDYLAAETVQIAMKDFLNVRVRQLEVVAPHSRPPLPSPP